MAAAPLLKDRFEGKPIHMQLPFSQDGPLSDNPLYLA